MDINLDKYHAGTTSRYTMWERDAAPCWSLYHIITPSHLIRNSSDRFRRFLFTVAQNNIHNLQSWKMIWSPVGLSLIDTLWCFLAFCFLVALCAHKASSKYETSGFYMLFQDLIRYGKTKQSLKRDEWLRVFDVPKRLTEISHLGLR